METKPLTQIDVEILRRAAQAQTYDEGIRGFGDGWRAPKAFITREAGFHILKSLCARSLMEKQKERFDNSLEYYRITETGNAELIKYEGMQNGLPSDLEVGAHSHSSATMFQALRSMPEEAGAHLYEALADSPNLTREHLMWLLSDYLLQKPPMGPMMPLVNPETKV